MIYELAVVEDRGTYWQVVNVVKNTLDSLANRNEQMLKLSYMTYQKIGEAIQEGKTVHIPKTLSTDEVKPGEISILDPSDVDPLMLARDSAITKIRMLITPELAKIAGLTLYGFTVLNNELISDGYVITAANREEQYLKILETGDEELISKLERYLNYKDEIERVSFLERKFAVVISEIKDAKLEEIDAITEKFLEEFYSRY